MEKVTTLSVRLKEAIEEKKINQTRLAEMTKIPRSSFVYYCSGVYEPNNIKTYKIAEVLNVNPLWLMGYDVPKTASNGLKQEIISQLDKMNEKQLLKVQKMIELMIEED